MNPTYEPPHVSPSASEGRPASLLSILELVVLASVLGCGLFTIARTFVRIHSTYQLDYAEGTILNSALRAVQSGLYPPLRDLPYQIDPYPPFIYKLVGSVVHAAGVNFFYTRLVVLLSMLLACLFAVLLIHHWTRSWRVAVAFGFMPLTAAVVQAWLGIVRYDFVGIALIMAGLAVYVLFPKARFCSLLLFIPAVAGLYTLVAAPGACCLNLWIRKERLKALLFGACLGIALIAGYLWGQRATAGWLGYHLFQTQHSPYSLSQLASFGQGMLRGYALLLLLSAVVIWKSVRERRIELIAIYWLLVVGTALSIGKIGAGQNHFLQLVFAASIAAGVAYAWLRRDNANDSGLALVLSTLAVIAIANAPLRINKPIDDLCDCDKVYAAMRSDWGPRILSDNVGGLVLAGRPVYVSDPFIYRWLVKAGGLPDTDLRHAISNHEFTSIVLNHRAEGAETDDDRWPESIRQAIRESYQLQAVFTCNDAKYLYVPRSANASSASPQAVSSGLSNIPPVAQGVGN